MTCFREDFFYCNAYWATELSRTRRLLSIRFLFAFLVIVACSVPSFGTSSAQSHLSVHLKVGLVSEEISVTPGRPVSLGLWFAMEQGWHIYWMNPGDSGEPPRVQWRLPTGFRAGAIQWPIPHRIADHTIVDYGYEGNVLLIIPLHAPSDIPPGGAVRLEATVKYLVCRDICIPGIANLALSLPVRRSVVATPSEWRARFIQTSARLPRPMPAFWKVSAVAEKDKFILTLRTGSRERQAVFFPFETDQIKNAAPQQAAPLENGIRLSLQKSDLLLKPVSHLKGVVVLAGERGFLLDVPVLESHTARRSTQ